MKISRLESLLGACRALAHDVGDGPDARAIWPGSATRPATRSPPESSCTPARTSSPLTTASSPPRSPHSGQSQALASPATPARPLVPPARRPGPGRRPRGGRRARAATRRSARRAAARHRPAGHRLRLAPPGSPHCCAPGCWSPYNTVSLPLDIGYPDSILGLDPRLDLRRVGCSGPRQPDRPDLRELLSAIVMRAAKGELANEIVAEPADQLKAAGSQPRSLSRSASARRRAARSGAVSNAVSRCRRCQSPAAQARPHARPSGLAAWTTPSR